VPQDDTQDNTQDQAGVEQAGDTPAAESTPAAAGSTATEGRQAEEPTAPARKTAARKTAKKAPAKKAAATKTSAKKTAAKKAAAVEPAADEALPLDADAATDATDETAPPAKKAAKKAPAKKAAAKRTTKKAAPAAEDTPAADQPLEGVSAVDAPAEPVEPVEDGQTAPAKKTAAKKATAKKAGARKSAAKKTEAPADAPVEATSTDDAEQDEAGAPTGAPVPLFQAPVAKKTTSRRSTAKKAAPAPVEEPKDEDEDAEATAEPEGQSDAPADAPAAEADGDDAADDSDESDDEGADEDGEDSGDGSPARRRRRRGGRRRRRGGSGGSGGGSADSDEDSEDGAEGAGSSADAESGAASSEDGDADKDAKDDGDQDSQAGQGEGSGSSRRRRRRRRSGEGGDDSADEPGTTTRVRSSRTGEDQITALSGSTRLEAKKQRRREGREAGRRRAPIVSEAEFLARRESVDRVMVIREREDLTQIAVLEDKVLVEHYVARESQTSLIGNVYLGRVQNVLPSMEAAFIDIGKGRNAVLYAGEVNWSALGHKEGQPRKIESVLSSGQPVLVQVTKDPIGAKGARLTSQISLAGRFLVYVPDGTTSGISRKLPDTERSRLKALLKEIVPDTAGVIVRTAAEGASEEELTADVERLKARWEDIEKKSKGSAPQLLYGEPDLTLKVVRDLFTEDFARLVIQGEDAWETVASYVSHVAPDLAERLERFEPAAEGRDAGKDVFAAYRVDEQIAKGLDRKVWLPSGGSLVIDRTEAMTVVDVNTGKFTGSGGNLEETVTKNNLEAAEEIVRQLRLRDIGGIIVVDFIDMVLESNRDLVLRRLVECLGRDRTRHQVAEVTSLGLVQMTRKRIGTGLLEAFSENCQACQGRGIVIHEHPVEPRGGGADDDRGGRGGGGKRSRGGRGGKGSEGSAGSNQGGQGGSGGSSTPAAPSPKDVAAMARQERQDAEKAAEATDQQPADEATSQTDQPQYGQPQSEQPQSEQPQSEQPQSEPAAPRVSTRSRSQRSRSGQSGQSGQSDRTDAAAAAVPQEAPAVEQPAVEQPGQQGPTDTEPAPEPTPAPERAEAPAAAPAGSSGVVTRTRRSARRTTPLTTGEAAAVVVDPTKVEPAAPAESSSAPTAPTPAPKVVTRTRSSRPARQGSVPSMGEASAVGGVGEPAGDGRVEPGTAGAAPDAGTDAGTETGGGASTVEHVPVKRKGARKR
jgi:ribonuclease E